MSNNETDRLDEFAEIFKALSNPHRLKILVRLATCCTPGTVGLIDPLENPNIGELGQDLGIVKSTLSHHIKELRRVGLLRTRRQGQKIECWVDPEILGRLKTFFSF